MAIPVTITDFIEKGKEYDLSHGKLSANIYIKDLGNGRTINIPFNSMISKYRDYFTDHILNIPLTEEEQEKYKYNPKKLSYDLYGTVEFWSLILYINECASMLDFDLERVSLIPADEIREILNTILIIDNDK